MKLIKKMIAASLALALALSMSGCYWNGKTYSQSKNILLDALEEKYGEEFKILSLRTGSGGGHLETGPLLAYCSPKDNEDLVFEAKYVAYGTLADTYIQSIVRKQMKEQIDTVLSEYFDNYAVEVYVWGLASAYDSGIVDADDASIVNFTEALPETNNTNVWIAIDKEEIDNPYNMKTTESMLDKAVKDFHYSNLGIEYYVVSNEIVTKCRESITDENYDPKDITFILSGAYCKKDNSNYCVMHHFYYEYNSDDNYVKTVDQNGTYKVED